MKQANGNRNKAERLVAHIVDNDEALQSLVSCLEDHRDNINRMLLESPVEHRFPSSSEVFCMGMAGGLAIGVIVGVFLQISISH